MEQNKYDIFISYSREDKEKVFPFVEQIRKVLKQECWMDLKDIESGVEFEEVIMKAIDECKIVLFMLSENSLSSEWTKREVYYAEGEKKRIVPVVIDDKGFRGWFKFHFGYLDYVDITSEEQKTKLLINLRDWLGVENQIKEPIAQTITNYKKRHVLRYLSFLLVFVPVVIGIVVWASTSSEVIISKASGIVEGHEYVDLQLPSGLKWARCNIGANEPEDFGYYYAWGETEQKPNYGWNTYKFSYDYHQLTKYNFSDEQGVVDSLFILEDEDDVARSVWGGGWRMPSSNEYRELIDNCNYSWIKINGVCGGLLKSRKNGKSIFFPATGSRMGSSKWDEMEKAECWTVDIGAYDPSLANHVSMDSLTADITNTIRNMGRPVRAVYD